MEKKDLEEKVKQVIIETAGCNPDKVVPEANLEDIGADGTIYWEVIVVLEEELNIMIPDEESEKFKTVGDLTTFCQTEVDKR